MCIIIHHLFHTIFVKLAQESVEKSDQHFTVYIDYIRRQYSMNSRLIRSFENSKFFSGNSRFFQVICFKRHQTYENFLTNLEQRTYTIIVLKCNGLNQNCSDYHGEIIYIKILFL